MSTDEDEKLVRDYLLHTLKLHPDMLIHHGIVCDENGHLITTLSLVLWGIAKGRELERSKILEWARRDVAIDGTIFLEDLERETK